MNHPLKMIEICTQHAEMFVLEVMTRKRHGPVASCARGWFWCLSKVFAAAVRLRWVLRR
jgi:hypothetical protein